MNKNAWKRVPLALLLIAVTLIVGRNLSLEYEIPYIRVLEGLFVAEAFLYLFYEKFRRS